MSAHRCTYAKGSSSLQRAPPNRFEAGPLANSTGGCPPSLLAAMRPARRGHLRADHCPFLIFFHDTLIGPRVPTQSLRSWTACKLDRARALFGLLAGSPASGKLLVDFDGFFSDYKEPMNAEVGDVREEPVEIDEWLAVSWRPGHAGHAPRSGCRHQAERDARFVFRQTFGGDL